MTSLYTKAEALAVIKAAPSGSRFAVHIRADAPIIDKPGRVFSAGLASYLLVSRVTAARLCASALSETLEKRGGRIPIAPSVSEYSGLTTYWIF